jgi:hypothetical protein
MTTFVIAMDDELNYKLLGVVKDVRTQLKNGNSSLAKYSKSQCVQDIVQIALAGDNKKLIASIEALRKKKGVEIGKK